MIKSEFHIQVLLIGTELNEFYSLVYSFLVQCKVSEFHIQVLLFGTELNRVYSLVYTFLVQCKVF